MNESRRQRTDEILREVIYKWLRKDFAQIEAALSLEMQTELDGLLWTLAGTLAYAGIWESVLRIGRAELGDSVKAARP